MDALALQDLIHLEENPDYSEGRTRFIAYVGKKWRWLLTVEIRGLQQRKHLEVRSKLE